MLQTIVHFLQQGLLALSLKDVLLFSPPLILYIALVGIAASRLRKTRHAAVAYSRKLFHFLIFTAAAALQIAFGLRVVVLYGLWTAAAVLFAVWKGRGFLLYDALARPKDAPHESLFILIPLASTVIGGVASNLWFPETAFMGYLVAGWADAAAEPVGARWGRHSYRVPSLFHVPARRTLEGSLAVFLAGLLTLGFCCWWMGLEPGKAFRLTMTCSLTATAVEGASNHGMDNLTVPIAVSGIASLFT
jgi:phytol kinase